jgi:hypothetical protein
LVLVALLAACVFVVAPGITRADDTKPDTSSQSRYECPACLRPVSPDAERCPGCGLSFKKLEYICPACSATIPYDTTVCPNCGQHFDPPAPGDKEKRSATARSMPDSRDFQQSADKGDEKPGIEVHGHSITLFRTGRETSFDGTTTVNRALEDLSITIARIGIPELSFHGSALFLYDQNQRPRSAQALTLEEAYLRYESLDEKTQLNVGRQFINCGVTREFVDSVFVHEMFGDRLGVEAFGGVPVEAEKANMSGDVEGGARVFFRGLPKIVSSTFRDLTVGFSVRDELWDWHQIRQDMGVDLNFSPIWSVDISGHAYYSFIYKDWYDARATLAVRPTGWLELTADYRYEVPSELLPANSLFVVFAEDRRHEFEGDIDIYPGERLKLRAYVRVYWVPNEAFWTQRQVVNGTVLYQGTYIDLQSDFPREYGGGFSYKHGTTIKGELGGELSLMQKGTMHQYQGATATMASVIQARIYEKLDFEVVEKHWIRASIDGHVEANDGKIYLARNYAATIGLTGGYSYDRKYTFVVGGDYRRTPDFLNTYDAFVKFEVQF